MLASAGFPAQTRFMANIRCHANGPDRQIDTLGDVLCAFIFTGIKIVEDRR